ncbi:MAG: Crp/Fnr family transcriptional regulator [Campylobacter sp.]|nr:Crp/Fnr family transcriptional regulator [Campylobacter sp.]MBQ7270954.1 Crp/Fnr family transcriptional regulator [Campylobacter sp.]MBR2157714.1 Crp/Fnr family transcriptional regulator [Campylobacter sp.]MBR6952920.1 Crp/Fnr family transcriptional regulator [Campylobacter sp.]
MDNLNLSKTMLFNGISENEINDLLPCIGAKKQNFAKDEIIFRCGDTISQIGLVLSGSVNIVVNFLRGNSNIFGHIRSGDIFGANYALSAKELICDVVTAEQSEILFLDMKKILTSCEKNCPYHHKIIYNLFKISSLKSIKMSMRMTHTAPKTIRERLLSYFGEQAMLNSSSSFSVPFSRSALADYLGVDRSAMSNELSKMARDGLISYNKNEFSLNDLK